MSEPQTQLQPSLTVDGIAINVPSLPEAVSSIVSAAQHGDNFSVCTLNLDHVVQLQQHANFRAAYRRARFVTADGFPIVVLSRLMGTRIERTTGADLVEPVCAEAGKKGLSIFLLGANDLTLRMTAQAFVRPIQGIADRRMPCAGIGIRSLLQRSRCCDRTNSCSRAPGSALSRSARHGRNCSRRAVSTS